MTTKVSSLSNDARCVGGSAGRRRENRERLMKTKMSSKNGGVAAAAAAAAAGASFTDEFAEGESPPNIDAIEDKAVMVQLGCTCAKFPTTHLSISSFDSHHCVTTARIQIRCKMKIDREQR